MLSRTNLLILLIALVAAGSGFWLSTWIQPAPHARPSVHAPQLKVGDVRPELSLPDLANRSQPLAQWNGKLLLLNFWASWCEPCREEMPLLDRTQKQFANRGLQVIGIAIDDVESVNRFLAIQKIDYPILLSTPANQPDASVLFGDIHGVLPYSVLIGQDGHVLAQHVGSFTETSLRDWIEPQL